MALYFVLFLGSTPIGAPIVGWLAETFSPRVALAFGGLVTVGACIYGRMRLPASLVEPRHDATPDDESEGLEALAT
ncbi:MAG: MFS transporter, partial [Actinomycetota bacterium]|nr:MFS transporter [Actinomycetota bacterium]